MSDADRPTWRDLAAAETADAAAPPPLALGFELRQRAAYDPQHWGSRPVEAVTPRALARGQHDLSLVVRPLTRGARGSWIKGDADWDAVRRGEGTYGHTRARWFAELQSLLRDRSPGALLGAGAEWLRLDTGPALVWPHLADAARLDIPLVGARSDQTVRLSSAAAAAISVVATADGGIRLAADIDIDGEHVDPRTVRLIGRSGLFAFTLDADPLVLTLAPAQIPDPVAALVTAGEAMIVDPGERAEFERDALPVLMRRATVRASGITLPAAIPPALRLRVAHGPGPTLTHTLEWVYPGVTAVPFDSAVTGDRDADAEAELAHRATTAWAAATDLPFAAVATWRHADAAEIAAVVAPALGAAGVRVETTGEAPGYRRLIGAPEITVRTVETSDPDWFDLGVIVRIDDRSIPLAPLLSALTRGRRRMLLADGAYFSLGHPALARLRDLVAEAAELREWETGPRIARTQIALWSEFEDLADVSEPALAWRALTTALKEVEAVPDTPPPPALRTELRPYQRSGLSWLAFLWSHRLGGILADDMGLGKTVQVLAFLLHARAHDERRPFLVVAPTSVVPGWAAEAARFAPSLAVRVVDATRARRGTPLADAAADAQVVITSYALLRLDASEFAGIGWAGVIFDEAQFLKNPATQLHRAAQGLARDVTFALTGTPLENSLTDLWALFSLTAPGLFPSARRFRDEYVLPLEKGRVPDDAGGPEYRRARLDRLRRRIRPLLLRRTKEVVAADLPPRQQQDLRIELLPAHRARYDAVLQRERQKVLGLLEDLDRNRFTVFRSLTLLRLLALSPGLVDPEDAGLRSSKLDALVDHLVQLAAEGHRALVFSQFTSFLRLAADRLSAAGIETVYLDGATRRRESVIREFREGSAPAFLLSLKAAGFGLTLVEADYVFLLDPWWNPATEAQAIDRTHRLGQHRSVFVYRLVAANTIEEKVLALQRRKADLFDAVVDDGDFFSADITAADIRGLLEG